MSNIEIHYVLKKPLLTEKNTFASNEQNRYAFEVDMRATKKDIQAAVEKLYKVKVVKVNTQVRKGANRTLRYGKVKGGLTKHALVRVEEGQKIEVF